MKDNQKVYIRGVKGRGDEVVKMLEEYGENKFGLDGVRSADLYFIDHEGNISAALIDSEVGKIIMDNYTELHMKPFEGAEISQEALNVSGVTEEQINAYPNEGEAYNTIIGLLNKYVSRYDRKDKFYLCGFNIHRFDNDFFRALFERHGNKWFGSYFWSDSLDAMLLAAPYLIEKRPYMPNFKQISVADALGVTIDQGKLHNADYDIELTQQIYDRVCGKY